MTGPGQQTDTATVSSARWLARAATMAAFLVGVLAIWLPPRPPMIDLPQFAGQVALLRGLLTGASPWAPALRLDAATPYLVGYLLAAPLALVMPVVAAVKLVLTAALAAFGLAAAAIRRELGAARALDAYALIGFFGFDYAWGLVTFLVAAPLGLSVVWLSLRYARSPGWRRGLILAAAALLLLFAHALVLVFALGLSFLLILARSWSAGPREALPRLWPLAPPMAGVVLVWFLHRGPAGAGAAVGGLSFGPVILRLLGVLAAIDDRPALWTILALIALLALPFLGGLRISARPVERLIIAVAVFGALALGPDWAWVASGIYRRFALFAPAAYAWLFDDAALPAAGVARLLRPRLHLLASALAGLILVQHVSQAAGFAAEARDFDAVMAAARPNQRALGLVLDEASAADVDLHVYRHFPSWYQAEKGGLVDPSFAAGAPSIVRYRQNPPGVSSDPDFAEHADRFDWRRDRGGQWTYFFVRDRGPIPAGLFAGAPCPPVVIAARGAWTLFQQPPCAGVTR